MKKTLFVIFLLATGILFMPSVEAAEVTFNYSGVLSNQTGFASPTPITFGIGSATVTGSYTFEDTTIGVGGVYSDALTNLSGVVSWTDGGSFSFNYGATIGGNISFTNDAPAGPLFTDRYEVRAGGGDGVFDDLADYRMLAFNMTLQSAASSNSDLTGTGLLPTPPLFVNPGQKTILLTFEGSNYLVFNVSNPTADTAPIPEPGTMLLLGSGLAGLVGYGRRRFKK